MIKSAKLNETPLDLKKIYLTSDKVAINPEIVKNNLFHLFTMYLLSAFSFWLSALRRCKLLLFFI